MPGSHVPSVVPGHARVGSGRFGEAPTPRLGILSRAFFHSIYLAMANLASQIGLVLFPLSNIIIFLKPTYV